MTLTDKIRAWLTACGDSDDTGDRDHTCRCEHEVHHLGFHECVRCHHFWA